MRPTLFLLSGSAKLVKKNLILLNFHRTKKYNVCIKYIFMCMFVRPRLPFLSEKQNHRDIITKSLLTNNNRFE